MRLSYIIFHAVWYHFFNDTFLYHISVTNSYGWKWYKSDWNFFRTYDNYEGTGPLCPYTANKIAREENHYRHYANEEKAVKSKR